jgi:hypothetical protein
MAGNTLHKSVNMRLLFNEMCAAGFLQPTVLCLYKSDQFGWLVLADSIFKLALKSMKTSLFCPGFPDQNT